LFEEYIFGKQTLKQLANKYGKTKETIRRHLDQYQTTRDKLTARPTVIGMDCTFFGRGYGIIVARSLSLKQNLYWKEISTESKAAYQEARRYLEEAGFTIQAVVIDAKHGIRDVFSDLIVQICQYHQQQIIQRYLTNRPKTLAGQELKTLADSLSRASGCLFSKSLIDWHKRWEMFLKERSYAPDRKHWWYTHRRLRSAYRSLKTNLPYLFSYRKYPELGIPNTNNSLEGYFSRIKQLLNNHHGLKKWRRYRLIQEVLNR
jgi:hypothetical protein